MTTSQPPSDQIQDELMSPEQVALRLGTEVSVVLRAIARGELPSVRLGKAVWIERAAFEHMLAVIYANYGPPVA
jgi:excisionase family DNA binding protein